jgi:pyruvate/2-oxoglutarate dehydrogenase complex dihydrolipoamide dehydrogenase (E3) component
MNESVDVAILGMGPGGETAADRLLAAGKQVAVIERELIGGECAYWACIPSKTLLRPPEAQVGVDRAAGVRGAELDWPDARNYRDYMIRHLDDTAQVEGYRRKGALVIKGEARIISPGRIQVGDRVITANHIIIATGADALIPPLEGIEMITAWGTRETFTVADLPSRAVIIGGSAVGCETATFLARFGTQVTLIHRGTHLLEREEPRVGEIAEPLLREAGIDIRLGTEALRARRNGAESILELSDGTEVGADVIIFATGRTPRTRGLGFETAGVAIGEHGEVIVDEQNRAAAGVWAIGDVTGIMPFTHVAKYHGRIVADAILGRPRAARYEGIPRVVFTDPEIAAVGLTRAEADKQGISSASAEIDLVASIARPWIYEKEPRGKMALLADTDAGVLIGAWAIAPLAGEWIHQAALAIREHIPIEALLDQVAQFPTYNEGYLAALEELKR